MAMLTAGAAAYAQIGQGSLMLGGELKFDMTGEKTTKITDPSAGDVKTPGYTNWNFNPKVGYFFTDNIVVGVDLNFGQTHRGTATSGTETETYSSFDMGLGLFGRYYMNISDNFYFYGQANVMYTSSSWTERDPGTTAGSFQDGDKYTSSGLGIGISPGLTFFPSPKWGIDLGLRGLVNFSSTTDKVETPAGPGGAAVSDTETTGSNFNIGFGTLAPTLGLHYYMGH